MQNFLKPLNIEVKSTTIKIKNAKQKYKYLCYNVAGISGNADWKEAVNSQLRKNALSTK
jgi:hypothetical protein|tara:strand:- start:177 stop:353 length:177 start_codon:yes stop_codon:yes gene_type:complete